MFYHPDEEGKMGKGDTETGTKTLRDTLFILLKRIKKQLPNKYMSAASWITEVVHNDDSLWNCSARRYGGRESSNEYCDSQPAVSSMSHRMQPVANTLEQWFLTFF